MPRLDDTHAWDIEERHQIASIEIERYAQALGITVFEARLKIVGQFNAPLRSVKPKRKKWPYSSTQPHVTIGSTR